MSSLTTRPSIQLALNILTSHLISKLAPGTTTPTTSSNVDAIPTVYIISPLASSILTAESLHSNLLSRSLPYEAALQSLDSVSILQVFDLAGLADAISEVADSLHSAQANRDETTSSKAQVPVLIILDSVDSLLEDVTRSSGIPRALSLFVPIQRQITHLSRVYSSFLTTLMVTNTSRASTFGSGRSGVMGSGESTSAFAGNPSTIGMGIVGRSVDEGTDVQLLAEIIDKKTVVEVVKNRVGGGIGRWGIWE